MQRRWKAVAKSVAGVSGLQSERALSRYAVWVYRWQTSRINSSQLPMQMKTMYEGVMYCSDDGTRHGRESFTSSRPGLARMLADSQSWSPLTPRYSFSMTASESRPQLHLHTQPPSNIRAAVWHNQVAMQLSTARTHARTCSLSSKL